MPDRDRNTPRRSTPAEVPGGREFESALAVGLPVDWCEVGLLIAVSGGADSVALLRAVCRLKASSPTRVAAAHYNHHLRAAESDADQQFVERLCEQLGIELTVGHAKARGDRVVEDSAEASLRAERYEFLRATAERLGTRYLVTAHTADDQAETALHHILRGTGLRGLAGMRRVRPLGPAVTMVRPMLSQWRSEVASYLASLGQEYREDCTNRDTRFTRNRIRHELLPRLEADYGPKVRESLVRLAGLAADAERVIDAQADLLVEQTLVDSSPQRLVFDRQKLAQADRHLVRQTMVQAWRARSWPLGAMGFADWNLLADMIFDAEVTTTRQTLPGAVSVQCTRDQLIIERSAGA